MTGAGVNGGDNKDEYMGTAAIGRFKLTLGHDANVNWWPDPDTKGVVGTTSSGDSRGFPASAKLPSATEL